MQKYKTYKCAAATYAREAGKTRISKDKFFLFKRSNLLFIWKIYLQWQVLFVA